MPASTGANLSKFWGKMVDFFQGLPQHAEGAPRMHFGAGPLHLFLRAEQRGDCREIRVVRQRPWGSAVAAVAKASCVPLLFLLVRFLLIGHDDATVKAVCE